MPTTFFRYDYAFITTYNSSKDGFLGTKFGFSASLLSSGGYSQQPPYNGTKLVFIEGPKGPEESTFVHFPLNGMKKGSSGGPWLMKESGKFYVVGLNSHRRQYSLAMISPKVDRTALELLEYASKQVIPEKKISTDLTCEPAKCALMCGNNRYEAKCTTRDDGCECTCKCLRG